MSKKQNRKLAIAFAQQGIEREVSWTIWHDDWLRSRGTEPDHSAMRPYLEKHIPAQYGEIARGLGIEFWRPKVRTDASIQL